MAYWKCTLIFQQNQYGWQETHYWSGGTLAEAYKATFALRTSRCKLLATTSICTAVRVGMIGNPRISFKSEWRMNAADTKLPADNPVNGILCSLVSGDENRSTHALRGMPDDWITFNDATGRVDVKPVGYQAAALYIASMIHLGFYLRGGVRPNLLDPMSRIISWGNDAGKVMFTTAANATWRKGDTVIISKVKGLNKEETRRLTGPQYVINVTANITTIDRLAATVPNLTLAKGGTVYKRDLKYLKITEGTPLRPTTRATGQYPLTPVARRKRRLPVV